MVFSYHLRMLAGLTMKHLPWILLVMVCSLGVGNAVVVTGLNSSMLPRIINAAPAEPHVCDPSYEGTMVYVDDTDDNLWSMVCVCGNNDDGTGYLWVATDDPGTPCLF